MAAIGQSDTSGCCLFQMGLWLLALVVWFTATSGTHPHRPAEQKRSWHGGASLTTDMRKNFVQFYRHLKIFFYLIFGKVFYKFKTFWTINCKDPSLSKNV